MEQDDWNDEVPDWEDLTPEERDAVREIQKRLSEIILATAGSNKPPKFDPRMAPNPVSVVKAVQQKFPDVPNRDGYIYTVYLNNPSLICTIGGGFQVGRDNAAFTAFCDTEGQGYIDLMEKAHTIPNWINPDRMVWLVYGERPSEQTDHMRMRSVPPTVDIIQVTDGRIWSLLCADPKAFPPGGVPIEAAD